MEMQDVKILSPPAHLLKHRDMQAIGIADRLSRRSARGQIDSSRAEVQESRWQTA
jgi:hypothetical protein